MMALALLCDPSAGVPPSGPRVRTCDGWHTARKSGRRRSRHHPAPARPPRILSSASTTAGNALSSRGAPPAPPYVPTNRRLTAPPTPPSPAPSNSTPVLASIPRWHVKELSARRRESPANTSPSRSTPIALLPDVGRAQRRRRCAAPPPTAARTPLRRHRRRSPTSPAHPENLALASSRDSPRRRRRLDVCNRLGNLTARCKRRALKSTSLPRAGVSCWRHASGAIHHVFDGANFVPCTTDGQGHIPPSAASLNACNRRRAPVHRRDQARRDRPRALPISNSTQLRAGFDRTIWGARHRAALTS